MDQWNNRKNWLNLWRLFASAGRRHFPWYCSTFDPSLYQLPSHEIVTGRPRHVGIKMTDPNLLNGDILHYFKGLIHQLMKRQTLVQDTSHSVLLGDEDSGHDLQPGSFFCWKRHLIKDSLQPWWRGPCQVPLSNPCTAELKGVDSRIHISHLKKAQLPEWTMTPTRDPCLWFTKQLQPWNQDEKLTTSEWTANWPKTSEQACMISCLNILRVLYLLWGLLALSALTQIIGYITWLMFPYTWWPPIYIYTWLFRVSAGDGKVVHELNFSKVWQIEAVSQIAGFVTSFLGPFSIITCYLLHLWLIFLTLQMLPYTCTSSLQVSLSKFKFSF